MDNKKLKSKDAEAPAAGPLKVFRIEDVSASVFTRDRTVNGEPATFYSVSFSRSYKDADGSRKYTKNFDPEDLGQVVALAQQAGAFIEAERAATMAA